MNEELINKVEEAIGAISEFADSVIIFVTSHEGGNEQTLGYISEAGNKYAIRGQVGYWVDTQKQYNKTRANVEQMEFLQDMEGENENGNTEGD